MMPAVIRSIRSARRCVIGKQSSPVPVPEEPILDKQVTDKPVPRAVPEETDRSRSARGFAVEAARLAKDTRCSNVVVLDVRAVSPVTDYFVIGTGTSPRQMRSVANEIAEVGQENGHRAISTSGADGAAWILLDCVDVIVHLFGPDARFYYDLEGLWGDARKVEWEDAGARR